MLQSKVVGKIAQIKLNSDDGIEKFIIVPERII